MRCPVCESSPCVPDEGLARCPHCTHLFQWPPVVAVRYDGAYLSAYDHCPTRPMACLRTGFLKAVVPAGRLLDVGYGKGDLVHAAAAAGFDAWGYDIHRRNFGVREVNLAQDRSTWDVVTFFDSLEHFPDFEIVRSLLRRSRSVLVSLPLPPASFPRDRSWKHYKPGEHLHYFSEKSLRTLVGKPLLLRSDVEDTIRRGTPGVQNILTCLFGPPADEN